MEFLNDIQIEQVPGKRRQIYQALRQKISTMELAPGSPFPTARAMAEHFGVSYVTMHSALSDLVRDGLLIRHKGKATVATAQTATKPHPRASRLAMVLPMQEDITIAGAAAECFLSLRGSTEGASSCGADLVVASFPSFIEPSDIRQVLEKIRQYDGAIFFGDQYDSLIRELNNQSFPVVVLGTASAPVSHIDYNIEDAIHLAVNHLRDHGLSEVGFFGTTRDEASIKYQIFSRLLRNLGIPLDKSFVQDCDTVTPIYPLAQQFLRRKVLPKALFVDNHIKARTLIAAAQNEGVDIPGKLAVVGYGAEIPDASAPSLSMVVLPYQAMGQEGALLLDKLVRGSLLPPVRKVLSARFTPGRSCGCVMEEQKSARQALSETLIASCPIQ